MTVKTIGINRPIPEILKDGLSSLKKGSEMHNAVSVLIDWYAKGCPSKEELNGMVSIMEDTCEICNVNNSNDQHAGNPYGYHSSSTPPCEWKIIT